MSQRQDPETDGQTIIRPDARQTEEMMRMHARLKDVSENRPELLERVLSTNEIMRAAHGVRGAVLRGGDEADPERLRASYPEFSAQYPVIFEKCCTPSVPLDMLPVLLEGLRSLRSQRESKEVATDRICEALNAKYVDPKLRELHASELSRLAQSRLM